MSEPTLIAIVVRRDDGMFELRSPAVGRWLRAPARGSLVLDRQPIGEIEVLGQRSVLIAPATGIAIEVAGEGSAARAVGYGELLAVLSPQLGALPVAGDVPVTEQGDAGLAFRSPSSGRYYGRQAPGKPPFVIVGAEIAAGDTVCLLEVMKTFNRVVYGGEGLPERARVVAIRPGDGDDLTDAAVILELERID